MTEDAWTVLARSPDREILGEISGWTALGLTLRLNEVGSWEITAPLERLPEGWPEDGCGVIVLRGGEVIASGEWDARSLHWSAGEEGGLGEYTLSGGTDLAALAYRLIYPSPGAEWESQAGSHWKLPLNPLDSANAEELMRVAVNYQAGSLALASRRVAGLRLGALAGVGTDTSLKERFTPLLDALRKMALDGGGLAFDVKDSLSGFKDFTVWQPADLSGSIRFARELGNVTNMDVEWNAPTGNVALVAGAGEMTVRHLKEYIDAEADPVWGRREIFVDQRSGEDTEKEEPEEEPSSEELEEYRKAGEEAYTEAREQVAVSIDIVATPLVQWGRDFTIGDRVSVRTPYGDVTDLVREVAVTVDPSGVEDVSCVIGSAEASSDSPFAKQIRKMDKKIQQMERGR